MAFLPGEYLPGDTGAAGEPHTPVASEEEWYPIGWYPQGWAGLQPLGFGIDLSEPESEAVILHDPVEVRQVTARFHEAGNWIEAASWSVAPGGDDALAVDATGFRGSFAAAIVSGGEAGQSYRLTCTAELRDGETMTRSFTLKVYRRAGAGS